MTTAFVTGATGFLGQCLCTKLRARGLTVHEHRREDGDIRDATAMNRALAAAKPDWVFHLAADTRHNSDPSLLSELLQTNVVGTFNLLQASHAFAFIAVGSFEEYGDNPTPFREDMSPRPRSPYGISKAIASMLVAAWPAVVIRLPLVYGPGQPADTFIAGACDAIRSGKRFAMTPGEQTRDFLYVEDAANALIIAAEEFDRSRGEVLNACTGVGITLRDAVQIIGDISDRKDFAEIGARPYRPDEQMNYVGDNTKISQRLGWKPQTSFAEGIRLTLLSG